MNGRTRGSRIESVTDLTDTLLASQLSLEDSELSIFVLSELRLDGVVLVFRTRTVKALQKLTVVNVLSIPYFSYP